MPFNCDTLCDGSDDLNSYSQSNQTPTPGSPPYANPGYVGFVKLGILSLNTQNILRVTSANLNLKQEISRADVVDGRIDSTVYQLGPKIVEGTLSMPIVADIDSSEVDSADCQISPATLRAGTAGNLLKTLWCWTTSRNPQGRLRYTDATLDIRYANHAAFRFDKCIVNTFGMSVNSGDPITLDLGVIGRGRIPASNPEGNADSRFNIVDFLSPARVLTWNDITVNGVTCKYVNLFFSNQVRSFNLDINNHADRFFTLNGSLFPIDINAGKREISGSLKLLGYQHALRELAENNQERFTEKNEIRFAFYIGEETYDKNSGLFVDRDWLGNTTAPNTAIFANKLTGVVFSIEEVTLTNEVLETTVNWIGMANDQTNYESINPSTSCSFPAWQ